MHERLITRQAGHDTRTVRQRSRGVRVMCSGIWGRAAVRRCGRAQCVFARSFAAAPRGFSTMIAALDGCRRRRPCSWWRSCDDRPMAPGAARPRRPVRVYVAGAHCRRARKGARSTAKRAGDAGHECPADVFFSFSTLRRRTGAGRGTSVANARRSRVNGRLRAMREFQSTGVPNETDACFDPPRSVVADGAAGRKRDDLLKSTADRVHASTEGHRPAYIDVAAQYKGDAKAPRC